MLGKKLNNTFNFISFLNDFPDNVVKGIGDEIMLYIPDEDLKAKSTYNDYFISYSFNNIIREVIQKRNKVKSII